MILQEKKSGRCYALDHRATAHHILENGWDDLPFEGSTNDRDTITLIFRPPSGGTHHVTVPREAIRLAEGQGMLMLFRRIFERLDFRKPKRAGFLETMFNNYPLYWELFGLCLPPKIRREAFEPAFHEALRLHVEARQKFKSQKMRRILAICFAFQTLWLVLGSFAELLKEKSVRLLCLFFPFLEKYFSRWRM